MNNKLSKRTDLVDAQQDALKERDYQINDTWTIVYLNKISLAKLTNEKDSFIDGEGEALLWYPQKFNVFKKREIK